MGLVRCSELLSKFYGGSISTQLTPDRIYMVVGASMLKVDDPTGTIQINECVSISSKYFLI